jgi:signal transduction histidine kinase
MATAPAKPDGHVFVAPNARVLWTIAVAGCLAAASTMALALTTDQASSSAINAALLDWIILSYIFSGLIAWRRRPESRFGPLMVVAGFVIALNALRWANADVLHTIGWVVNFLPPAVFLHVYLAFPTGHLQGARERALVIAAYVTALGLQVVGLLLGGFGPGNVLDIAHAPEAAEALLRAQLIVLSALLLAGVAVLSQRRRRAGRPARRSIALLVDSFAVALVMNAVLFITGLFNQSSAVVPIQRVTFVVVGLAPIAFLFGLLHARLARSAVAGLVVELRGDPDPAELRDALARALRDESLALVYWIPGFEGWADQDGQPVSPAELSAGRSTTLIDRGSEHMAALLHDPALDDEPELLKAVAAAAALALENGQLQVELRARVEDLRGSRARLVEAGDAERRRIERDLHDGAQQRMVAIALQLRLVQGQIREDPGRAEELVKTASSELALSLSELRDLARGIHPAVLEHGLSAALDSLAVRSTVPTTVSFEPAERLPERFEFAAYFVACEALANVAKHAHATNVTIRVWRSGRMANVQIADDGVGGVDDSSGSGLRGLADRVEALEGSLHIRSAPGAGTVVTAEMPCAS